ncbi:unnamed protein product [Acanthoscelides obtectus]|uniref:Uncharacterized protein n=1 Tax=Acanthoscelides obtectus TaxID=200917 RepID=A0A9P0MA42_ACAOB|nr:unnamed protein product [Acanthoscelides obtectus]CAK1641545.1 hypothetical protein AOBTE_LOCUS12474 [Acanthoscelides obtectus]
MASTRPLTDRELQEEIDNMSDMNDSDFDSDDSIADETFTCNFGSESDDSSDSNGSSPVASDEDIANNIPNPNNLTIPWSSTVKMLQRHQFTGKSGLLKNIICFDGSDEEIIEDLLEVAKTTTQTEPSTGEHFMSKIPRKDDGKIIRKRCHECYRKNQSEHGTQFATKKTKQVDTYCSICNKPFCLSCFAVTHKNKNQK